MNTLTERNITYDRSGNLLTLDRYDGSSGTTPAESLSYSYSGPKRSTWTYDAHANVTADPQGGLDIEWNALDLPRTVTVSGTGTGLPSTQRGYLADGSLAQVSDGTTTRLYLGDIVFNKASNGTVTLESAGWEGGRLLPGSGSDKVLYTVADHLGSVRVVKDGMGNIRQRFDYYPYGTVSYVWTNSSTADSSEKRYRFGGKEIAGSSLMDLAGTGAAPGAPYLDFGARLYSPRTATWLSPDPLMEKYYDISSFLYCAGNPVNLVDPNGAGPETLWDLVSLGIGVKSFKSDVKSGRVFAAILDGVGILADGAAVALPLIPGGAGAIIKAFRGADWASDAVNLAKGAITTPDVVQAANKVDDIVDATKSASNMSPLKRGVVNEARTLEALGETKNTERFTVQLKDGTVKTTIPDINNSTTIGEIKDVNVVNNTKQIQAEAEAAIKNGKRFILYKTTNSSFQIRARVI